MNLAVQILIGIVLGLVLSFISVAKTIKAKEKAVLKAWAELVSSLNFRYLKLKNVMEFLKKHMPSFGSDIDEIIDLCTNSSSLSEDLANIQDRIYFEDNINCKLEYIKSNMQDHPSIYEDKDAEEAIMSIVESEVYVKDAIEKYNLYITDFNLYLSVFLVSFIASFLNKTSGIEFKVSTIEDFANEYVDENLL